IDDKGPIIASIFAAAKLLNAGFTPKKRLRFILGCDEESGWKCMERYAKTEEMPASGFSPDADFPVINCEKGIIHYKLSIPLPHGIINFKAGTRANVVPDLAIALVNPSLFPSSLATTNPQITSTPIDDMIQLTACGISAHASTPQEGRNALITILELLAKDSPLLAKIYTAFSSHDGSRCGLNFADEMSGNLTLNLATADIENDILTFKLDIRYPVTHNKETIQGILSNISDNIQIDEEDGHLPLYVPCDDPLVTTLLGSYNKIMNTNLKPCSIGGGTYARFLKHGVAFGPSFPNSKSVVHQKDEYISLEDFSKIIDIYYDALSKLIFS
ncbi:MAG: Sapep family Mn(2+)-dependent dipeptidase, partial [Christensenellaceae bacterium]|nr:Sapep family Mn(2+)-dependent dipeptidase [Christensenellaceae bacterium]